MNAIKLLEFSIHSPSQDRMAGHSNASPQGQAARSRTECYSQLSCVEPECSDQIASRTGFPGYHQRIMFLMGHENKEGQKPKSKPLYGSKGPWSLEQEMVNHNCQRKVPGINPRDKTAGDRLSILVKASRVEKNTDQFPVVSGSILTSLIWSI